VLVHGADGTTTNCTDTGVFIGVEYCCVASVMAGGSEIANSAEVALCHRRQPDAEVLSAAPAVESFAP